MGAEIGQEGAAILAGPLNKPIGDDRPSAWPKTYMALIIGSKGPLSNPTTAVPASHLERLFVPHCRHCRRGLRTAQSGVLVMRFGVLEDKSEITCLSQFQLLNATGSVWLNP